jgi:beta-N-acetylhexosaminidase
VTLACIFGCAGPRLTPEEQAFFQRARPWGFILFARNVETPEQVRALISDFRRCVDDPEAPALIDQEGGRVRRLRPPHWPAYPPAAAYGRARSNDPLTAPALARLGGRLIAHDLRSLGITADCAPVADVPAPNADPIIGDRAFAPEADAGAALARSFADGLLAGGVLPVVKHIPGHGRAQADSHLALPVVEADLEALERDFRPFRTLSDLPMAMTAHVVYTAIDPLRPATTSRRVIRRIREDIGFTGLLMSDDLAMKALSGDFSARSRDALRAGCDVVLHCNGDMTEMLAVAAGAKPLTGAPRRRAEIALARRPRIPEPLDAGLARVRFEQAFPGGAG